MHRNIRERLEDVISSHVTNSLTNQLNELSCIRCAYCCSEYESEQILESIKYLEKSIEVITNLLKGAKK